MPTTYAALLAGINIGRRQVPMAELRALLAGLGFGDVRSYLASGNAVFTADGDEAELAARVSAALEERFGFPVACVVRTHEYLGAVIGGCPFPAAELAGRQLHAVFFSAPVAEDRYADVDRARFLPEEFRLGDRVLYLYVPDGLGRSQLSAALSKPAGRLKGVVATGRNWNTVTALAGMTRAETTR